MTSKIRDLVEILPAVPTSQEDLSTPEGVLASFVLTYESGDTISRVVESLSSHGRPNPNCLLVGTSGSGKSTLLSVILGCFEVQQSASLHPRFTEICSTRGDVETIVVRIGQPQGLHRLVFGVVQGIIEALRRHDIPVRDFELGSATFLWHDLMTEMIAGIPTGYRLLVAVDDLDEWLRGAGRFAFENLQTLVHIGELSQRLPVVCCAVVGAGMLFDDTGSEDGQGWMAALVDHFRIEYLPSHTVRIATASKILKKNARQRREILEVLGHLRGKLPELNCTDEEFIELYPLEVSTWTIGGHLHRFLPDFSFPEFAARAAESVRGRPAISLFALNDMFAMFEPQLRRVNDLSEIFSSYDELVKEGLPRLGQSQRLWGRLALQSIFMHTIAGLDVDVVTLTNSVLLYSLHGGESSYAFMSAVLKQLEAIRRDRIVASGDGNWRRYAFVRGERDAALASITRLAEAIDDDAEISFALLSFGRDYFRDWPLGTLEEQARRRDLWELSQRTHSVTLVAKTLDGNDAGSVDFESSPKLIILSPGRTWSEAQDLVRQNTNAACWIGGAPTPAGRNALRRWLAVSRIALTEKIRFSGFEDIRAESRSDASFIFSQTYIDRGTLITADQSQPLDQLVDSSRSDNLLMRLLPKTPTVEAPPEAAIDTPDVHPPGHPPANDLVWLAHLVAESRQRVESDLVTLNDVTALKRLEHWYSQAVAGDISPSVRLLTGKEDQDPRIRAALAAKQQFDVSIYYARRVLASGFLRGFGESIESVFETPDALWQAKESFAWLQEFSDWLVRLEDADRYLQDAEPLSGTELDQLRSMLKNWIAGAEAFADPARREAFEDGFLAYKNEYARHYLTEHARSVSAEVIDRLCSALIESQSWRLLESLSNLSIGNPSYLVEAANLLSVLREAQCDSDVEAALKDRPRCLCGFQVSDRDRVAALATSASEFIQTGIEHHRKQLHSHRAELKAKLKARKHAYDVATIKTIATLASDDDVTEVSDEAIAALNDLLGARTD